MDVELPVVSERKGDGCAIIKGLDTPTSGVAVPELFTLASSADVISTDVRLRRFHDGSSSFVDIIV